MHGSNAPDADVRGCVCVAAVKEGQALIFTPGNKKYSSSQITFSRVSVAITHHRKKFFGIHSTFLIKRETKFVIIQNF